MKENYLFDEKLDFCLREDRLPFTRSKAEVWRDLTSKIETDYQPASKNAGFYFLKVAAVACFAVITLAVAYLLVGIKEVNTHQGTIAVVELPDGSVATLNGNATLKYNASTWNMNRKVNLKDGEAFFEVQKGAKFTVNTPNGDIEVLGTSFNVSIRNNELDVSCKTGSIEVHTNGNTKSVILMPGEQLIAKDKTSELVTIPIDEIGSWLKGEFFFDNVDIKEVFEVVADQTKYTIELSPGIEAKYTGQFRKSQSLKEILDIVCLPLNLNYSIDDQKRHILISKN